MCDTGGMMCVMGRSMLNKLKMNKSKLVKVTERLVAAIYITKVYFNILVRTARA